MRESGTVELMTGIFGAGHSGGWEGVVVSKLEDFSPTIGCVLAFRPTTFVSVSSFTPFSLTLFDFAR